MSKARVLIVHPDPSALALLTSMLRSLEHVIDEAANDRVAARLMERGGLDLVLAGVDPTDPEGLELLSYVRRKHRQVPVVLLFSATCPERAKEALRQGALTVLKYPIPATELRAAVTQALGTHQVREPQSLATHSVQAHAPSSGTTAATRSDHLARDLGLIGQDPSLRQAVELAATIASARSPVLLVGEHGTGKALLARAIHALSGRSELPLVTMDCPAVADAVADTLTDRDRFQGRSELAESPPADWTARLAQAQGATLFLEDVGALPDALQGQLLRAVQGGGPETYGSYPADTRFLMSTTENLLGLVEQGKFRQDLYYRLSVICLKLSPLRHRGHDIETLAEHFRARFALEFGKNVVGFTRDALDILHKHDWPGNVGELEGVIQRGVVLCQGTRITSGHLAPGLGFPKTSRPSSKAPRPHLPLSIRPLKEALEEPEKRIIIQALQALNWNRQETARVLDINRTTLYKKMKKYGLLVDGPIWVN